MLQRFILANGWWEDRLEYARYAHVPIGNFGADAPSFVADIFFSRLLRRQDHLLWMSRTSTPDLGHGNGTTMMTKTSGGTAGHGSDNSVSAPGAYRSICVELDIFNLAVNTMLEVQRLSELEGKRSIQYYFTYLICLRTLLNTRGGLYFYVSLFFFLLLTLTLVFYFLLLIQLLLFIICFRCRWSRRYGS